MTELTDVTIRRLQALQRLLAEGESIVANVLNVELSLDLRLSNLNAMERVLDEINGNGVANLSEARCRLANP